MRFLAIVAAVLFAVGAHAMDWQESPAVAALFAEAEVQGTFVLLDVSSQRLTGHNQSRARTRYIPASTFKIPNSLIGLAVGAVRSVDEVLPYGGQPQPFPDWERDMGLREAIVLSNVPIYQALARRIGLERMRDQLAGMRYGNGETGEVVDTFWLRGPLAISAVEQVHFLADLARDRLPFPEPIHRSVREIVRLEAGEGWTLYGKSGWVDAPDPGVGWWVGWVEKGGRVYAFALNIDIRQAGDAAKRMELGRASLCALGVI
jgi:beta-lactamase class D